VSWNNLTQLLGCVESITKNSSFEHEIIIVHNCKLNDYEIDDYEKIANEINIFNGKNVGLSEAANKGVEVASKEYVCLIDDDMEVQIKWDVLLLKAHKNTGSDWVCSTNAEPIPNKTNISIEDYENGKYDPGKHGWHRQNSNTPLLIPQDFWESIGGYDEEFPNVGAELGLAKRAYDNGVKDFVQTPFSVATHHQSQSMKRRDDLRSLRRDRDLVFRQKYGITRIEFTKLIGKGERYDPSF
jgi:GT2 family glycosyltransferase